MFFNFVSDDINSVQERWCTYQVSAGIHGMLSTYVQQRTRVVLSLCSGIYFIASFISARMLRVYT